MKKLIILRGLPGSGKSREAKKLEETQGAVVCSADVYFVESGVYKFDPTKLGEAHAFCQRYALRSLREGKPLVVIDNTNVRLWEFALYAQMGEAFGYEVVIQTVGGQSIEDVRKYAARGIHGVPELKILEMAYRWEE